MALVFNCSQSPRSEGARRHLDVQGGDVALQVLLGLHLLVQLLLQAVPLVLQLPQLGGHVELLPGFFLEQLLHGGQVEVQGPTPRKATPMSPLDTVAGRILTWVSWSWDPRDATSLASLMAFPSASLSMPVTLSTSF